MTTPTFPPPPNYSAWSKPQLIATQAGYQNFFNLFAQGGPRILHHNPFPRLDYAMYANWLSAINTEIASRP